MPVSNARAVTVTLLLACALACASGSLPPAGETDSGAPDSLHFGIERACEDALSRVDEWIAARDLEPDFPRAALAEARELREAAVGRLAAGDYELALELLQAAESLLQDRPE